MKSSMALLSVLLCACTVGEPPKNMNDAGGGNADDDKNVCEPRATTIAPAHNHGGNPVGARARTGCMDTGCHAATGGGAMPFAFAGTVYKEPTGTTLVAGATVRIFKMGNNKSLAEAVTDDAGNFYIPNPGMYTAFPYITHATVCGVSQDIRLMNTPIADAGTANCNAGTSCHGAAGSAGAIYLSD